MALLGLGNFTEAQSATAMIENSDDMLFDVEI